ncbi:MAG TPA: D-alanyl-D-alanine carboxypeptidase [Ruminococcus sp.]|nr:D-alanyl-D-alanine carboxypeptidase [Ruminococcus sp.]
MKKWICAVLSFCMVIGFFPVQKAYAMPEVSASACILIEAQTGEILFEKNAFEKRSMASTTKIMTTLLTIESGDLDTEFVVDTDAIHVEGSSMGLVENDIVTKRALCYGMLLPSGNDAANASAVAVAGSIPEFAKLMNARAKEIGMTRTCFVTPSGLEGEGHGSSAYDMALLTRTAMQNEIFRSICCQSEARVKFGNPPYERTLYNSNKLLKMYDGVIGVKTGFTDEAGRCLVSACERDGIELICVTLNDRNDWNDHMTMYDYGFSEVQAVTLDAPDNLEIPVTGGTVGKLRLYAENPVIVGMKEGMENQISVKVRHAPFVYAPIEKGDTIGTLEYYYKDTKITSVPLLSADSTEKAVQPELTLFDKMKQRLNAFLNHCRETAN